MFTARFALFFCALAIAASFGAASPKAASENDCSGTPVEAVMTLPAPLNKWGKIICTPYGHVLSSHTGWAWIHPNAQQPVFIPAQMVDRDPLPVGNAIFFTKIEVSRINGNEYAHAYEVFHQGFDEMDLTPEIYRAEFTSVSGDMTQLYFLDYGTYAWGIWCSEEACDRDTRFVIVNKKQDPREGSV